MPRGGDAWLSEESQDDGDRLHRRRVWIVDPLHGTREFLDKIPEWCISVGLVEDGRAVAGGVLNPCTGEMFLGSREDGLKIVTVRSAQVEGRARSRRVLVSRREMAEGKWSGGHGGAEFVPVGSIAYRLAQVAAGWAGATCTFDPRHEWHVAAGVALVEAAGGWVRTLRGQPVPFNRTTPGIAGLLAFSANCHPGLKDMFQTMPSSLAVPADCKPIKLSQEK